MAEYRPDTCAYCQTNTWCERRRNGEPQCRACKVERFFERFLYPPLGFRLLDWQRQFLRTVYGNVNPETGLRQYRRAYRSTAKKNGKSFLFGGIPIYHLCCEDDPNPEAYGAAAAKDQASIIFKAAATLVRANAHLMTRLKVLDSTKKIVQRRGRGFYQVVSADGDVNDGIEPSLALIDELHRWKTKKAEAMYAVITKGTISRKEPLIFEITTAGDEYESPLWFSEHQYAQQIIDGTAKSDSFYAEISAADPRRIAEDPEYWKSREARVAANPSHEDLGGFLEDTRIVEELEKAIAQPEKYYEYLRFHLNVPIAAGSDPVVDVAVWRVGSGGVDIANMSEYDVDSLINTWELQNRPCFAGVDASWTTDFTALELIFPAEDGADDIWKVLSFFWVPRDMLPKLERQTRQPLRDWVRRRFLNATEGNAVDLRELKKRVAWAGERFDLREIGYDPWNFRQTALSLNDEGFQCIEVRQGYPSLTAPTKKLLELYTNRKLWHGNHPVLNWHAACLSLDTENDNAKPAKPARTKAAQRIDGISALVTGMNRAMLSVPVKSAYSDASQILI